MGAAVPLFIPNPLRQLADAGFPFLSGLNGLVNAYIAKFT